MISHLLPAILINTACLFQISETTPTGVPILGRQALPWPSQSFKTTNHTPPVLNISRTGPTEDGLLFLAPLGEPPTIAAPLIMSDDGQLVWHGPVQKYPTAALGLQPQKLKGKEVLAYWNGVSDNVSQQRGYGAISILDKTYTEIHRVSLSDRSFLTTNNASYESYLDVHEDFITDRGTIVTTATNVTRADLRSVGGPEDGWIIDSLFYEIDIETNKVMFSWSTYDHLKDIPFSQSFYPLNGAGQNQSVPWNYFVMNSAQLFGDDYIVSSRYYCSVYRISSEGDIKWRLQGQTGGDFQLGPGAQFCYQHDVRLQHSYSDGFQLHMHNNANDDVGQSTGATTGLLLDLDLNKREATLSRELFNPRNRIQSYFMGSYQPLNNHHVFLGHGFIPQLVEFDATGREVYAATFGNVGVTFSYRGFRREWLGEPLTVPDVFACASGGTTAVYMSWNGATEYTDWDVYGGERKSSLSKLSTVCRTGFETKAEIDRVYYVQVAAKVGNKAGTRSSVVAVQQKC